MPPVLDLLLGQGEEGGEFPALREDNRGGLDVAAGRLLPLEFVASLEGVLARVLDICVEADDLVLERGGPGFGGEELLDGA